MAEVSYENFLALPRQFIRWALALTLARRIQGGDCDDYGTASMYLLICFSRSLEQWKWTAVPPAEQVGACIYGRQAFTSVTTSMTLVQLLSIGKRSRSAFKKHLSMLLFSSGSNISKKAGQRTIRNDWKVTYFPNLSQRDFTGQEHDDLQME